MKIGTLEIVVFITGAAVMIFEIVGSRVLAPYLGTSIFTWTALIGVILGSLSAGYFLGGRASTQKPNLRTLGAILLFGGVFIGMTVVFYKPALSFVSTAIRDLRVSSLVAATILFAPASVFLGMVTPYASRLRISSVERSGEIVGNLTAISTVGSILGTFLTGFFLLAYLGINTILWGLTGLLIGLAIIVFRGGIKVGLIALLVLPLIQILQPSNEEYLYEGDTSYSHVRIFDHKAQRFLQINRELHSAIYTDRPGLVFPYAKAVLLAARAHPEPRKALMLGGGAYTLATAFIEEFPVSEIDVVEIDPRLERLAESYFGYKKNRRVNIFSEDGRIFINRSGEKYDLVINDAYSSLYSIPYQLTTREALIKIRERLNSDGLLITNVISALDGPESKILQAQLKTMESVFPTVKVFPVKKESDRDGIKNIIMIASVGKQGELPDSVYEIVEPEMSEKISSEGVVVLTDEFAPIDFYLSPMLLAIR